MAEQRGRHGSGGTIGEMLRTRERVVPALPMHRARDVLTSVLAALHEQCPGMEPTVGSTVFRGITVEALSGIEGVDGEHAHGLVATISSLAHETCRPLTPDPLTWAVGSVEGATRAALLVVLTAPASNPLWEAQGAYDATSRRMQEALSASALGKHRKARAGERFVQADGRALAIEERALSRTWVDLALEHLQAQAREQGVASDLTTTSPHRSCELHQGLHGAPGPDGVQGLDGLVAVAGERLQVEQRLEVLRRTFVHGGQQGDGFVVVLSACSDLEASGAHDVRRGDAGVDAERDVGVSDVSRLVGEVTDVGRDARELLGLGHPPPAHGTVSRDGATCHRRARPSRSARRSHS